jgi:hypothetical protein
MVTVFMEIQAGRGERRKKKGMIRRPITERSFREGIRKKNPIPPSRKRRKICTGYEREAEVEMEFFLSTARS